jgi:hypothetical protein
MASGANPTSGAAFLKRFYSNDVVINTVSKFASPLLNLIKSHTDGAGDSYNVLTVVGDNPSGSATWSEAQERGQNAQSSGFQFKVDWYDDYGVPSVSKGQIARTRNQKGGWIPVLRHEIDSNLRYSGHRRSCMLYNTGFGELATVTNAIGAGKTVTVGNPRTGAVDKSVIYRFVKGMKLVFSATISANLLRAGQSAVVDKVNYSAGTFDTDVALNTIGGLAQNDVIFTKGDRQDSATPARLRPAGLAALIPTTAPTPGESFYGVDRTNNSFLYGWIIDATATGVPLAQAITTAAMYVAKVGHADKAVCVLSLNKWKEFADSQEDKQYTQITGNGGTGYEALVAYADGIKVTVISDQYLADSEGYVLDPKAIDHPSMGAAPHMDDEDGNMVLRQANDAGIEARTEAFECLINVNGAATAVLKFA